MYVQSCIICVLMIFSYIHLVQFTQLLNCLSVCWSVSLQYMAECLKTDYVITWTKLFKVIWCDTPWSNMPSFPLFLLDIQIPSLNQVRDLGVILFRDDIGINITRPCYFYLRQHEPVRWCLTHKAAHACSCLFNCVIITWTTAIQYSILKIPLCLHETLQSVQCTSAHRVLWLLKRFSVMIIPSYSVIGINW